MSKAKKPVRRSAPAARKSDAVKPAPETSIVARASLPPALAARAKAQHQARMVRLAERARAAVALVRERQSDVAANMVDIGLALLDLKAEGMAEALGRTGFAEVCVKDLSMSVTTANGLIMLATKVPRAMVTRLGFDRARAVLELVDATPTDDTPENILRARLTLPSGATLAVADASTQEIRDAAKEFRAAQAATSGRRSRGFSATPAEKAAFAALAARVAKAGGTRPQLVATRDGKGARVRFEVRLADVATFAARLHAATRR